MRPDFQPPRLVHDPGLRRRDRPSVAGVLLWIAIGAAIGLTLRAVMG